MDTVRILLIFPNIWEQNNMSFITNDFNDSLAWKQIVIDFIDDERKKCVLLVFCQQGKKLKRKKCHSKKSSQSNDWWQLERKPTAKLAGIIFTAQQHQQQQTVSEKCALFVFGKYEENQ